MKPISIGIVGLSFGKWMVRALRKPALAELFQIGALSDLDGSRLRARIEETNGRAATFEEILENPAIPLIGLFTGPVGRAKLVRRAIRAGKDVMTTKPFERDSLEAQYVLEEARSLGRIVHLNSPPPA